MAYHVELEGRLALSGCGTGGETAAVVDECGGPVDADGGPNALYEGLLFDVGAAVDVGGAWWWLCASCRGGGWLELCRAGAEVDAVELGSCECDH